MRTVEWHPTQPQQRILQDTARFTVACAGRRGGKTQVAAVQALQWAQDSTPTYPVWWVAPQYDLCTPGLRTCLDLYPNAWVVEYSTAPGNQHIDLAWGGRIVFKSSEKEQSLRGRGLTACIAEEVGEWRRSAWEEALRPTLADAEAPALFIGTPKGHNWFYELYQRGQREEEWPEYSSHHWTTRDNPHIPSQEVEEARRSLPEHAYRQEYLAEFVQAQGSVFDQPRDCVQRGLEDPVDDEAYVAGWDVAKHEDWSVVCVDRVRDRHTVAFDRFQRVPYREQARRVTDLCADYGASIVMDATGVGDPVLETTRSHATDAGLEVHGLKFTSAVKQNLVNNLAALIGDRDTSWPDIPVLTNELEMYEWKGDGRSGAPEGMHDDAVIAKALAQWGITRGIHQQSRSEDFDLGDYL